MADDASQVVRLKVTYKSPETLLGEFTRSVGKGAVVLESRKPLPPGTRFVFEAENLPALQGALDLAGAGVETGGAVHNRRFVLPMLTTAEGVAAHLVTLAHDPQTSGGLLAAIPAERA